MGPGIYFNDLNRNSVHDIYIYNNVFAGNLDSGVRMSEGDGDMYNILIYANTVAGTQNGIRISSASVFTGTNEIKNNIFTDIVTFLITAQQRLILIGTITIGTAHRQQRRKEQTTKQVIPNLLLLSGQIRREWMLVILCQRKDQAQ
jgi:polygalacturonase